VAHQGMWCHRENMVAQGECGGIERIWWLRGDVLAHLGMWWPSGSEGIWWLIRECGGIERKWWLIRECGGIVGQMGCCGSSGNSVT
jgi:hypothetical protein